jgi:hypothetical protein
MMSKIFHFPLLSSWNGPAALPYVVQILEERGIPLSSVRFIPEIGHPAHREILPYHDRLSQEGTPSDERSVGEFIIRLGVNVRTNNRLSGFVPLIASGMLSDTRFITLHDWNEPLDTLMLRRYKEHFSSANIAMDETPVDRLTRQLCEQYPELRENLARSTEQPPKRLLLIRQGHVLGVEKELISSDEEVDWLDETLRSYVARELAELIFTNAFLFVSYIDIIGGFEFVFPFEPEGRQIPVILNNLSRLEDVVRWLNLYPHLPVPVCPEEEQEENAEFYIDRENDVAATGMIWTEHDLAVQQIYSTIRQSYEEGRVEDWTPYEILALVRRYLPEYVPFYPHQSSVIEGINLNGALIRMMRRWWLQSTFLGLEQETLNCFTPEEVVVLAMLLILRRYTLDWLALFQTALRLLVHSDIQATIEPFMPRPARLGTPFAQLGRTLFTGELPLWHDPQVVVRLPWDRTQQTSLVQQVESKVKLLIRLFVPAHLPVRCYWSVDWAILGETAYLAGTPQATSELIPSPPRARLGGNSPYNIEWAEAGIIEEHLTVENEYYGNDEL